jgi:hypothetical protein
VKLTAALIASCALMGAKWSPPPRDWLALQTRSFGPLGGFMGVRVSGRFASRRACEASLWPAGYVTVVAYVPGAHDTDPADRAAAPPTTPRVRTYYARWRCVHMPRAVLPRRAGAHP